MHRIFHQPDSDGNLKLLEPLPTKLPELAMELPLVARLPKSNRGAHDLAHDGILLAIDRHLCDFWHFLHDAFDLRRVNFLAADIDDLRLTSEDSELFAVHFDLVARIEPAVVGEGAWRVEIAEHRRLRLDLEDLVHDTGLKSFAPQFDPE